MTDQDHRICPVEKAGSLDNRIRRWFQNPKKILGPYIDEGMTVLDIGCGPGFFSIDMAELVGTTGHVIASDVQEGMLEKLRKKIQGTQLEARITLHKCTENRIGISEKIDFIIAFYMVHEVPSQEVFFDNLGSILNPDGQVLIVEPPFHVSKSAFEKMIVTAGCAGLKLTGKPKVLLSKTAVLKKSVQGAGRVRQNKGGKSGSCR